MEAIRERKTVRSFVRSFSFNQFPSLLVVFASLFLQHQSLNNTIIYYRYSPNLTAHLHHRPRKKERWVEREIKARSLWRENLYFLFLDTQNKAIAIRSKNRFQISIPLCLQNPSFSFCSLKPKRLTQVSIF